MKLFNDDFTRADRRPSGQTVPDHFFEDFKASMEQKIDAYEAGRQAAVTEMTTDAARRPHLNLRRRFILWTSVAACLGLLMGLALPFEFQTPEAASTSATDTYADVYTSETQEQLEQDMMLAQLSDYDIFEYYYYEED
jgi:hypothetical protein